MNINIPENFIIPSNEINLITPDYVQRFVNVDRSLPLIKRIILAVSNATQISVEDIKSSKRDAPIFLARAMIIYIVKNCDPTISYNRISQQMGDRDHKSLISAHNRAKAILKFAEQTNAIISKSEEEI